MRDQNVLVLGSSDSAAPVLHALRERGLRAWHDVLGHALTDRVSLDWADALVVLDVDHGAEVRHIRPLPEFHGPCLLVMAGGAGSGEAADLIESGFDAVLPPGTTADLIAAMTARRLRVPVAWLARNAASDLPQNF